MSLPELVNSPKPTDLFDWLKSLEEPAKDKEVEVAHHVANQIVSKIFDSPEDALRPFATRKKYALLKKENWSKAHNIFTDISSDLYIPNLVHLGGLLKTNTIQETLSFNHKISIAKAISAKVVKVDGLKDFIDKITNIKEEDVKSEVDVIISNSRKENIEKSKETREKRAVAKAKADLAKVEVEGKVESKSFDTNPLNELKSKIEDLERKFRSMEDTIRELLISIEVAIKLGRK